MASLKGLAPMHILDSLYTFSSSLYLSLQFFHLYNHIPWVYGVLGSWYSL